MKRTFSSLNDQTRQPATLRTVEGAVVHSCHNAVQVAPAMKWFMDHAVLAVITRAHKQQHKCQQTGQVVNANER
ncbi:GH12358 [Drosophila grimshawi]|uniref:GH12358 n=1 Tax=Drosophila grimshawi TaxID=7222 RepID=B4JJ01_DROGR|nr:GH12358 [Drosophila grimshawi]